MLDHIFPEPKTHSREFATKVCAISSSVVFCIDKELRILPFGAHALWTRGERMCR